MMDSASTVGHRCGSDAASGVRQNAPSGKGASLFQSRSTRRSVKQAVRPSLPVMLGLAFSNVCFNVAFNESTAHFEDALRGNAPVFVALALMGLFMLVLFRRAEPLRPETATAGAAACIAAQILSAAMLGLLDPAYVGTDAVRILATSVMDVGALGALGYWLRCASGASAMVAAIVVFGAVIVSAPFICAAAFMPYGAVYVMLGVLGVTQVALLLWAKRRPIPADASEGGSGTTASAVGYFGLARMFADDKRLLVVTAVGIWILALAKAVIRVFPFGTPIPYTTFTIAVYFVLSVAVALAFLCATLDKRSNAMSTGIWLIMQGLAALALVLCGFFPDRLDVGLSFTYVLDVLLLAYTWYVALAFIGHGRQDPYYYVAGGLIAFLLPRSLTNVVMPVVFGGIDSPAATAAVAAALLLACAQYLFLRLPRFPVVARGLEAHEKPMGRAVERVFGVEEPPDTSMAMRMAIARSHAGRMRERFLLSDRETEVLALYLLGYTQEKIAGELFLSPGTVHTYIKRIYGKTNFHSRQDALDYIERYAD
ncbi:MAG TPA: helix-turn-helix transcriptional regulator [Rubneribacter badeniensis]|uniref:Helix-turn-helix transcriptional regulator n=1 Tax=Rubneribacter badeniensis TaxID=2070688 RepID=A0A9D3ADF7_9ACTN|nr:helix-turn-helix transcriptional regulator [Rubneribacter badeniensis]